ncbi:hypothetical protein [Accumulibacter sp.]|uniref:hypothetical protein n=1 Tax=Accumulibacter sp. TaxID=2053492 RepID=UPI001B0FB31C|nr:hypothetical protein [Accumulibacter sp.]MBO3703990.1 hypothetical protein [Accumulibacter sp.]
MTTHRAVKALDYTKRQSPDKSGSYMSAGALLYAYEHAYDPICQATTATNLAL